MATKTFDIILDASMAVYYSGQPITGRVVVHMKKSKSIRGIRMKVRGEAHVHIRESGGTRVEKGKFRDKHDIFDGSEVYLDTELYLFGQPTGEVIVPEGDSSYPFSVPLPQNLPPSFEGEYGSVRYYLAATMDVAWQLDPENTVQFSVVSLLDLNEDQVAKKSLQVTREKYLCCCACRRGPITMVISLPSRGYVPGQDIPLTVEVDNTTSQPIVNIICQLFQEVKFYATRPQSKTKTSSVKIFQHKFPGVDGNNSSTLVQKLRVPAVPPSYLKHCSIIDVSYILTVQADIKGPHLNLYADADLVIGTIPLLSSCPNANDRQAIGWTTGPQEDPRPAWHSPQPWDPTLYPNIPPPTYEAYSVGSATKGREQEDVCTFTPYYPIFSLPN